MRTGLYSAVLLVIAFNFASAQRQPDRFAYVITDTLQTGKTWTLLRKLDFKTGEFSSVLLSGADKRTVLFDAASRKPITASQTNSNNKISSQQAAFATGVAAAALDRVHNRLYFAPMTVDQLRYIDLATMKVYCVTSEDFTKTKCDINNPLARMAIAGDGFGYIITNDSKHLVRFTTTRKPVITDLGALIDDSTNHTMTIYNFAANAGGDMIADADNNLYVFTPTNRIYKVDVTTRVTKFIGMIKGVNAGFITNGAAVDDKGNVIVTSSIYSDAYYIVNPTTWTATAFKGKGGVYHSSDLATSNILFVDKKSVISSDNTIVSNEIKGSIGIYPNPVTDGHFTLHLTNLKTGKYNVYLFNMQGVRIMSSKINVKGADQTERISFDRYFPQGTYIVKVVGKNTKMVFDSKLMVP